MWEGWTYHGCGRFVSVHMGPGWTDPEQPDVAWPERGPSLAGPDAIQYVSSGNLFGEGANILYLLGTSPNLPAPLQASLCFLAPHQIFLAPCPTSDVALPPHTIKDIALPSCHILAVTVFLLHWGCRLPAWSALGVPLPLCHDSSWVSLCLSAPPHATTQPSSMSGVNHHSSHRSTFFLLWKRQSSLSLKAVPLSCWLCGGYRSTPPSCGACRVSFWLH